MKTHATFFALFSIICISSQGPSDDDIGQRTEEKSITFHVRDEKGQPVVAATVRGRTFDSDEVRLPFRSESLERAPQLIFFRHNEMQLGGFAKVTKDSPRSQDVKLMRFGSLSGRLIDERMRPMKGKRIEVVVPHGKKLIEDTPTAIVKDDGTFTVTGLVPGLTYSPRIALGHMDLNPFSDCQLEAGETKDLGLLVRKVKSKTFFGVSASDEGIVHWVCPSSPAEDAGIVPDDRIMRFDGREVAGFKSLQASVARRKKGDTVDVEVVRGGERRILKVVLSGDSQDDEPTVAMRGMKIHVLDFNGMPVKGVRVYRNHIYKAKVDGRTFIENKNYFTNAEGKTTITFSGISVDLRLWAIKEDFVPLHAMWAKDSQSDGDRIPLEFTFQLQRGTEIGGVVADENGAPIKDVKVEVHDRTARVFHSPNPDKPGIRPVRSYWLTGDEGVLTDAKGRWKVGNVPPDQVLVFRGSYENDPGPKIALRFSHPDYAETKDWGLLQREQGVTLKSLRDNTATIVLKPRELAR